MKNSSPDILNINISKIIIIVNIPPHIPSPTGDTNMTEMITGEKIGNRRTTGTMGTGSRGIVSAGIDMGHPSL